MLTIASALLSLVMVAAALLVATYHQRVDRDFARIPVSWVTADGMVDSGPRWRIIADTADGRWVDVVIIVPGDGAQLPPGLTEWPAPGEVVLSSALAGTAAGEAIVDRYGEASARTIGMDGVVSASERIAYVRPSEDILPQVSGLPYGELGVPFTAGSAQIGLTGGAGYQRSLPMALAGFSLVFAVPAIILMAVAARAGSARRDRRLLLLDVLGASPRQRAAVLRGAVGRPLMLGGALAALAAGALMAVDVPVPGAAFTLLARDARAGWPAILLGLVAGWVLCLAIVLAMNLPRRALGTRPRPRARRERWWKLLTLPLACILSVESLLVTLSWEDNTPRIWLVYGGVAIVALTLGPFVGAAIAFLGRGLALIGRRTGSVAAIVAGRQLLGDPKAVRRLATGASLLVVLVAVILVLSTLTNSQTREALRIRAAYGSSILEVSGSIDTADQRPVLGDALADQGGAVIARTISFDGSTPMPTVITGECAALEALSLTCETGEVHLDGTAYDPRLDLLVGPAGVSIIDVRVGDPFAADVPEIFAVSASGGDLPVDTLRRDLAREMLPAPALAPIGEDWIVGLQEARDQARWNTVGAGAATMILGLAIAAAVLGDTGSASRRTAVLSMWGAGAGTAIGIVAGRVLLPMLVAVAVGGATALVITFPLTLPPLDARLPPSYVLATVVLPLIAAGLVALVGAALQARAIVRWRPGASE